MKNKILGVIVLLVIILGFIFLNNRNADDNIVKIGFIGPLTGNASSIGQNVKAAVEVATDEINKNGGIKGKRVEVIYEDGKCDGKAANSAAQKLINVDKVSVILGGTCSGETMAITDLAETSKIPVLSYCSSNPAITNAGDYIFRIYPSDTYQGKTAAEYLKNKIAKNSVAIVYEKTDWGEGIKNTFTESYKTLGGNVVAEEGFDKNSKDLKTQFAKVKSSGAESIYFLGYPENTLPAVKQMKDAGITIPVLGGDAWDDPKLWSDLSSLGDGFMYLTVDSPLSDEFKTKMLAKTGSEQVTVCTPQAYDGLNILAEIIGKVGEKPEAIKNALYKIDYKKGVSAAEIRLDQNGDLVGAEYSVKVVANGKAEIVK